MLQVQKILKSEKIPLKSKENTQTTRQIFLTKVVKDNKGLLQNLSQC